ncbi:MAG: PilZ domain-containing protein [Pseudomonadota bacterium]
MRRPAKVTLKDTSKLDAETIDVSLGGVSLSVHRKVAPGQYCAVTFDVEIDSVWRTVSAVGQVIYCIDSTPEGFHLGVQFLDLDAASTQVIREVLN